MRLESLDGNYHYRLREGRATQLEMTIVSINVEPRPPLYRATRLDMGWENSQIF